MLTSHPTRRLRKPALRSRPYRPVVEALEDRLLLATVRWIGGDGLWSDAARWDSGEAPVADDDVVIDRPGSLTVSVNAGDQVAHSLTTAAGDSLALTGGSLTLAADSTLAGDLSLGAGAMLAADGVVTLAGTTTWSGGTLAGSGSVSSSGTITVSGSTGALKTALTNTGSVVVQGGGVSFNGGTLTNSAVGTIDFQSDAGFAAVAGTNVLHNAGTLKKSAGNGTSTVAVVLDNPATLRVQSGTVAVTGAVSQITGTVLTGGTWEVAGGTLNLTAAPNLTTNQGNVTLDGAASAFARINTLTTNAGTFTILNGRNFAPTAAFTNSGRLTVGPGSALQMGSFALNNQAGGTLDLQNDTALTATGTLTNAGTFQKSAGAGTLTVGANFNNTGGTVAVESGTVVLRNNGTSTGGTLNVAANAALDVTGGFSPTWTGTWTSSGGGQVQLNSGTLFVGAAGATFDFPAALFQWTGGTLSLRSVSPSLTNAGSLTLAGPGARTLTGILNNSGTVLHAGAGELKLSSGTFNNQLTGLYEFQTDTSVTGSGTFNNAGTLRKSDGSGFTSLAGTSFNNQSGTVDVRTGTLLLSGGTSTGATYNVSPGALLDLTGGSGGARVGGTYTGSGGGTVRLSGGSVQADAATTLNFPAGLLQWTGGTIHGGAEGNLTNVGFLTLSGPDVKELSATLTNPGTVVHTGTGAFQFGQHLSTLLIQPGGVFDLQTDASLLNGPGGFTLGIVNAGTFRKSGGSGTSTIGTGYTSNGGTLEVRSGTLVIDGGGAFAPSQDGTFDVAAGALVSVRRIGELRGTYHGVGGGTVELAGRTNISTIQVTDGTVFDFPGPMLQWAQGAIQAGVVGQPPSPVVGLVNAGTLNISGTVTGANTHLLQGGLVNTGTIIQTATVGLELADTFDNQAGALFDLQSDAGITQLSGGNAHLQNEGTLRKSAGAGVSILDGPFGNTGTIEVNAGTLRFTKPITQLSGTTLTAGTWNATNGATLVFPSGANITTNRADVTLSGAGATFAAINNLASNTGDFSLLDGATFTTVGNLSNSGTLTVGAGALAGSTLSVHGTLTQTTAGTLAFQVGGPPASGLFGQLQATGSATLDGALAVSLVNGFGPSSGQTYPILSYASRTGNFAAVNIAPFTASVGATNVILNGNGTPPDLATVTLSPPASGVIGQPVTIPYTVQNGGGVAERGEWVDSFYLSLDDQLSSDDTLIGRVTHRQAEDLPALGNYSDVLHDTLLPGVLPGTYRVLLLADSRGRVPDANRANNLLASAAFPVGVTPLALSTSATGTIADGQDRFFQLELTGGQEVRLTLDTATPGAAELALRYRDLPSAMTADQFVFLPGQAQQQLILPSSQPGVYFIRIHGRQGAGGQAFEIKAEILPLQLQSIGLAQGANVGRVTIPLEGAGFTPDLRASLVNSSGTRQPESVLIQDSTRAFATFDLAGLAVGAYDVQVAVSDTQKVLPNAFQVVAGKPGQLDIHLALPGRTRAGAEFAALLEYANTGQTDLVSPIIVLESLSGSAMRLHPTDPFTTAGFSLLALSPDGPAGVLRPGQRERIRVYVRSGAGSNTLTASVATADDTTPINWDAVRAVIRPPDADAEWDSVFDAEARSAGPTEGDYVRVLARAATLHTLRTGERSLDPSENLDFLILDGVLDRHTTLSGYVYLNDTRHPAGEVTVRARNRTTGEVATAVSSADGLLRFQDLTPGTYGFTFLDQVDPIDLRAVTLTANQRVSGESWTLPIGGELSGHVVAPPGLVFTDDQTIFRAVELIGPNGVAYRIPIDAHGFYTVSGVLPGTYDVAFDAETLSGRVNGVRVESGRRTAVPDMVTVTGGSITGTVRRAGTGEPLAEITVSVLDDQNNARSTFTDQAGFYQLDGVAPGTHTIAAGGSVFLQQTTPGVAVAASQTTAGIDFNLGLAAGVRGRVTTAAGPVVGAVVDLFDGENLVASAITDAAGNYTTTEVPAGTWTIQIDSLDNALRTDTITLGIGQTLTFDAVLTPAAFVGGTVRQANGGQPLADVPLTLLQPDGAAQVLQTGADGLFGFSRLADGHYTLMLADGSHRQELDVNGPATHLDLSFTLSVGTIRGHVFLANHTAPPDGLEVALIADGQNVLTVFAAGDGSFEIPLISPGTYGLAFNAPGVSIPSVQGVTVTGAADTLVPDVLAGTAILVLSFRDAVSGNVLTTSGVVMVQRTDLPNGLVENYLVEVSAAGTATLTGLAQGTYRAQALLTGKAAVQVSIPITAGTNAVEMRLGDPARLSGVVRDAGGAPVEGITLTAFDPAAPGLTWRSITDAAGLYDLPGLPVGTYTLVAADDRSAAEGLRYAFIQQTNVALPGGPTVNLPVTLSPATISVPGRIVDGTGSPPVETTVEAFTPEGVRAGVATADVNGVYALTTLAPGSYVVRATADGYSISPRNIVVPANGPLSGIDLNAVWRVDPPNDPPDSFLSFVKGLTIEKVRMLFRQTLGEPKDFSSQLHPPPIPDDCPEALAWLKEALYWDHIKTQRFRAWHLRWDGAIGTVFADLGLFGTYLGKLAAGLLVAGKAVVASTRAIAAAKSNIQDEIYFANSVGNLQRVAQAEQALQDLLKFQGSFAAAVREGVDILGQGFEDVLSLSPTALSLDPSQPRPPSDPSPLVGLKEGIQKLFSGQAITGTDLLEFAANLSDGFDRLQGVVNAVQLLAGKVPGLSNQFGEVADAFNSLASAIKLLSDSFSSIKDLAEFEALYNKALTERNRALGSLDYALDLCDLRRRHTPLPEPIPKPPHTFKRADGTTIGFNSSDPNDIIGPAGFGAPNFVPPAQTFPYTIHFENLPTATAPAATVAITHQLDTDLDFSTFELSDFGFGSLTVSVPAGRTSFSTRVDARVSSGVFVDVSAGINVQTGLATWTFTTIDPITLDAPADPLAGFLPPDNATGRGAGFVSYTVRPTASAPTDTRLDARATIIFDQNAPLDTAPIFNTLDTAVPTSSVQALPATIPSSSFTVGWSGQDGSGSGIATFDVFVSDNGGPFQPFQTATPATSAPFSGQVGHTYRFFSVATDNVGFRETDLLAAQAVTSVVVAAPPVPAAVPAAPPAPQPRPVGIALVLLRRGKKKLLMARASFSGGLPIREVVSPFQKPAFVRILAILSDADGDGLLDSIRFTAARGKKRISRIIPL